jgi:hypothetical protein
MTIKMRYINGNLLRNMTVVLIFSLMTFILKSHRLILVI